MKKTGIIIVFIAMLLAAHGIPAQRGQWRSLPLADGGTVLAELRGDEHAHFWQTMDGRCYVEDVDGYFVERKANDLQRKRQKRVAARNSQRQRRIPLGGEHSPYIGEKKGIIILAEFTNKKFMDAHDRECFDSIANAIDYKKDNFYGSVRDYFKAQSNGQFELTFDVVGPVQLDTTYQYYGKNDSNGDDMYAGQMIVEACLAVNDSVDFSKYDWDGDGYVEQVFVLYAGKGEATSNEKSTIWPHEYDLIWSDYQDMLFLDSVYINTYSCGNEVRPSLSLEGIGVICHEFSHGLGLPDAYDLKGSNDGMAYWDVMDMGCYCGDGFIPCNYTAYERMYCGWTEPIELCDSTVSVRGMQALSDNGDTYIIYNDDCRDEYLMLENRQLTGWDVGLEGNGLLVTHVDFDPYVWDWNLVNTYDVYCIDDEANNNDHQRYTFYHADNKTGYSSLSTDTYPYLGNNSLSDTTKPAVKWFRPNNDGNNDFQRELSNIVKNEDGTIDFDFRLLSDEETGIDMVHSDGKAQRWFSIDGRPVGANGRGVMVTRGKKARR